MTDAQLAGRAATGQTDAFWELYRRHRRGVHGFAARLLRDAGLAEDAAHEAFLRAYEHIDRYDEHRGSFMSWILAIAHHECCRLRRRDRRLVFDDAVVEGGGAAAPGVDPDDRLDLERALGRLPDSFRVPILLVKLHGLRVAECAQVLGLTPAGVKQRIHRGLVRLRREHVAASRPAGTRE